MGKLKNRSKPCSRGKDCCMLSPCQWSNLKKKDKDEKKKDKKDKDKKKDKKKKKDKD